jgi:hypothetical protein
VAASKPNFNPLDPSPMSSSKRIRAVRIDAYSFLKSLAHSSFAISQYSCQLCDATNDACLRIVGPSKPLEAGDAVGRCPPRHRTVAADIVSYREPRYGRLSRPMSPVKGAPHRCVGAFAPKRLPTERFKVKDVLSG